MGGWDAPWHWIILAIVVIALFGYKKMPDAARSVGRSLRIFKTEIKGMTDDDKKRDEAVTPKQVEGTAAPVAPVAAPQQPVQAVVQPVPQAAAPVAQAQPIAQARPVAQAQPVPQGQPGAGAQ